MGKTELEAQIALISRQVDSLPQGLATTPAETGVMWRNLAVLVRPERRTVLVEPRLRHCQGNTAITLLIAVFSAPGNSMAREIVR